MIDCRRYSCTDELIHVLVAAMVTLFLFIITLHPVANSEQRVMKLNYKVN